MSRIPPGPRSLLPGRYLRRLQHDPIPFFTTLARDYGDAAQIAIGRQKIILLNEPELIREVLVVQQRSFHKSPLLQRTKVIFGNGLLTSEDEFHLRQRRMAQPAFHRERIARYADVMVERATAVRERWRDGVVVDMHDEMMQLTLSVVARTLFNAEVESQADEIGVALGALIDLFPMLMDPLFEWKLRLPLPATRPLRAAMKRLDHTIYAIIEERRSTNDDRGDLLSMLLLAQDTEGDGGAMTDRQLRDEAMTLFLAGHETTANALSWTFYLLAHHPEIARNVERAVDDALGGRTATADDYPRLPYVEMVLAESMRLYPPVWAMSRLALTDLDIGGWQVPKGAVVVLSQAVMHRDARFWVDPARFDPLRFTAEAKAARPKFSYFPFGGGTRVCIGEGFAWMEGVLLLATLMQNFRAELLPQTVVPQASITLRPRGGIQMRLQRRA